MLHQFYNWHTYVMLALDAGAFALSLLLAYGVRFGYDMPGREWLAALAILPLVLVAKGFAYVLGGVYRGLYRYTSLHDVWQVVKASALGSLIIVCGLTYSTRFDGYPRSVFVADFIFTIFLCAGIRAVIRWSYTHRLSFAKIGHGNGSHGGEREPVRVLVLGAGTAASMLIRDVQEHHAEAYRVVGCLDDDPAKHHRSLLGIGVLGPISMLRHYVDRVAAHEIFIALPSLPGARMREIIALCEQSKLPYRTVPSFDSVIGAAVTLGNLRQVDYEDLLGRPPVTLNLEGIGGYLKDKVVLVSGAGGSIGSELCRQIARFKPTSLVLVERCEFNLYRIEMELRGSLGEGCLHPVMADVQDAQLMDDVFRRYRPQVVFHAAAYKHVPMVEFNPWEAVLNNVQGTRVILDVAERHQVERCVVISTDKAVRPTNVMGATKRAVEILLQSRPQGRTHFMAVRFGNVLGSSGSVIPLFQEQIAKGGPVTVTDPDITRYFMSIPEASQLVLQAGSLGDGGEIFVLEMGTPVRIADMARDLIRLSGREPDRDIPIVFTGLRPGEKRYEELITHGEGIVNTTHEKIMVLRRNGHCLEYGKVLAMVDDLTQAARAHDAPKVKAALKSLIPEYVPSDTPSVLCPPAA